MEYSCLTLTSNYKLSTSVIKVEFRQSVPRKQNCGYLQSAVYIFIEIIEGLRAGHKAFDLLCDVNHFRYNNK